jgi:hypothetical protein
MNVKWGTKFINSLNFQFAKAVINYVSFLVDVIMP